MFKKSASGDHFSFYTRFSGWKRSDRVIEYDTVQYTLLVVIHR